MIGTLGNLSWAISYNFIKKNYKNYSISIFGMKNKYFAFLFESISQSYSLISSDACYEANFM